jgi:anaerobic selenocysteine-containing dehydrogenase
MRRGNPERRGHFIQFEPRMSQTGSKADDWFPIVPGTEGMVAAAIGRLVAEAKGEAVPEAFANVDRGWHPHPVTLDALEQIAQLVVAFAPVAIPGGPLWA